MKRLFALFLALSLMLCACKKEEPAPTTEATTPPTQATEIVQAEVTEPPVLAEDAVHPLTGEKLTAPFAGRVATFTINNAPAAMPQAGISGADWLYEVETEGDITRCLGLYTDLLAVDQLGPIRSARTYFSNITKAYDAVLFHCGGSKFALNKQYDENNSFDTWDHVNEMAYTKYFFRDAGRLNAGYAYEHTLYTTGNNAALALQDVGYVPYEGAGQEFGLTFQENVDLKGETATEVVVRFKGSKPSTFTYDPETKLYSAAQYGTDWIDENTGETLTFNNVMVIQTEQRRPEGYHSFYTLIGEGTGYLAINGQIVPIKWSREELETPFVYTLEDGSPVTLNQGKTYCGVIALTGSVEYK